MNRRAFIGATASTSCLCMVPKLATADGLSVKDLIDLPAGDASNALVVAPLDPSNPIDAAIKTEYQAVLQAARSNPLFRDLRAPIQMSSVGTVSHPTAGIFACRRTIAQWLRSANISDPQVGIRFLIAHEMAHMAQFHLYGRDNSATSKWPENRRTWEAQADIIGGRYLVLRSSQLGSAASSVSADALRFVGGLGAPEIGSEFHPSSEKRLTAVRYGMTVGEATVLSQSNNASNQREAGVMADAVGYSFGMEPFGWARHCSEMIVHYGALMLSDLHIVGNPSIVRSNAAGSNILRFRLQYLYSGGITCNISMVVAAVSRGARIRPENAQVSSAEYNFSVNPGDGHVVSGALVVPPEPAATSSLLYWPAPESMASALLY